MTTEEAILEKKKAEARILSYRTKLQIEYNASRSKLLLHEYDGHFKLTTNYGKLDENEAELRPMMVTVCNDGLEQNLSPRKISDSLEMTKGLFATKIKLDVEFEKKDIPALIEFIKYTEQNFGL